MNRVVKQARRCVTLIEMMIVMFLIAMIIGVVGYNYQGSMNKGKEFKSRAGAQKLESIVLLHMAEHPDANLSDWQAWVQNSPLVSRPDEVVHDGWGGLYSVAQDPNTGRITITDSHNNVYP